MAFKPSARRVGAAIKESDDMLPILGLMCILIPLLLSSTQTVRLGMIEISLPPAKGPVQSSMGNEPRERATRLDASITITEKGFYMGSALGVADKAGDPTIIKRGDEYDLATLNSYLAGLKVKAKGKYTDINRITVTAEEGIPYKYIVNTMDAAREYRDINNRRKPLFPDVSIAAGIQ